MPGTKGIEGGVFGREMRISAVVRATPEVVFAMWSNPAEISGWWGPRGFRTTTHEMDFREGGAWRFVMHSPDGVDYGNHVEYTQIVANARVAYKHRGEGAAADVKFESLLSLEPVDPNSTRLTLTMTFESEAECLLVGEKYGAVKGGRETIARLSEHARLKAAEAFVMHRDFRAPKALVYSTWTKPARFAQWFGPKGYRMQVEGGELQADGLLLTRLEGPGGLEIWGKWQLLESVPGTRLVFLSSFTNRDGSLGRHPRAPHWPQQSLCSADFREDGGVTSIEIRWAPIEETAAERQTFVSGHAIVRAAWTGSLDQLNGYLLELMAPVHLTPVLRAQSTLADQFERELTRMVAPSRAEPGCLEYNAYRSKLDPDVFMLWERWTDQLALDLHCETPHFRRFVEFALPMLAHPADEGMHFLKKLEPGAG